MHLLAIYSLNMDDSVTAMHGRQGRQQRTVIVDADMEEGSGKKAVQRPQEKD